MTIIKQLSPEEFSDARKAALQEIEESKTIKATLIQAAQVDGQVTDQTTVTIINMEGTKMKTAQKVELAEKVLAQLRQSGISVEDWGKVLSTAYTTWKKSLPSDAPTSAAEPSATTP